MAVVFGISFWIGASSIAWLVARYAALFLPTSISTFWIWSSSWATDFA